MALEELQNGRYRRVRLLGSGGMGEVYLMQDTRVNRQVAIKVIRSEVTPYPNSNTARDAARLFQREARAIAALEHPNILPLYDFGEEILEGTTLSYIVMPYCPEGTLAGWLQKRGNAPMLSIQDIAALIAQAADALQNAHDHNIVHLDVKPSNYLIRSNKKTPNIPTLLLADFGVARLSAGTTHASQTIRGTPTSMAPEQWSNQPVPATDQYALAVMAYELLTGRPPFYGGMEQLMYQHLQAEPQPPSTFNRQLSPAIDAVLLRALAKKPSDRFPSVSAFASAFEQAALSSPAGLVVDPQEAEAETIQSTLAISQAEARDGTSRVITLPGGERINVSIPAGAADGQIIRLPGSGEQSNAASKLILTIAVKRPEDDVLRIASSSGHDLPTMVSTDASLETPEKFQRSSISEPDLQTVASTDANPQAPEKFQRPSLPVSERVPGHDLPTLATTDTNPQAPEKLRQVAPQKKRSGSSARVVSIVSGVIILLLLAGSAAYFYSSHQPNNPQSGANAINHAATATASAKPTPTATFTPTPTPQNGLFIAGTYNGSMFNQATQQTTNISVNVVQTQGSGVLSGTFTFTSPNQAAYQLSGTVDMQGNFSFTVQQPAGQTPLYFYGAMQQSVYLHGNFCNSSTNACSTNTGYFTAGPKF